MTNRKSVMGHGSGPCVLDPATMLCRQCHVWLYDGTFAERLEGARFDVCHGTLLQNFQLRKLVQCEKNGCQFCRTVLACITSRVATGSLCEKPLAHRQDVFSLHLLPDCPGWTIRACAANLNTFDMRLVPGIKCNRRDGSGPLQWMLDSSTIDGGKTGICYQELGADSHNLMGYRMATESIALQISEWLKNCGSLHKTCNNRQRNQDSTSAKIRLVYLDIDDKQWLVDAKISGPESDIRYVTLSHRWSNTTKAGATTKANVLERYRSLSLDEFPSHFKEAIALIRRLGFEHIWIDSLCIIQDSQDDWLQQASLMHRIYSRGVLNLAPLGELSNSDDVRPSNNTEVVGCILRVSDDDAASENLICWKPDNFDQTLRESVLYSRGWTFQERLLSTRTVHFGHQQYWECCSLRASTTFPTGVDFPGTFSDNFVLRFKELSPDLPNKRMGAQDLHALWCCLVRDYSRKTFTRSSDKLVAFRGVVERLEQVFPPALHEYMHGLWSSCLPEQLLWGVEEDCNRGASRTTVLPSWSWASRTQETKFVSTHLEQVPFRIRLAHFVGACAVSLEKYCASEGVVQMDARPSLKFNGVLVSLSSMDRSTLWTEFDSDSCFAEEPSIFLFPALQTMTRVDGLILQPIEIGDGVTGCGTCFQRLGIFQSPTNIFEKVVCARCCAERTNRYWDTVLDKHGSTLTLVG